MSNEENSRLLNNIKSSFKNAVIKDILKSQFGNTKTRINDDTVELIGELAKIMAVEAALRASRIAKMESIKTVTLDHTESIIPQMLLDFP